MSIPMYRIYSRNSDIYFQLVIDIYVHDWGLSGILGLGTIKYISKQYNVRKIRNTYIANNFAVKCIDE